MRVADITTLRDDMDIPRPNRLVIPLGDFGDEVPESHFGQVTDCVVTFTDALCDYLNTSAPEIVRWWSAPVLPYGPARARKGHQAALGLLPNKWFDTVAALVDQGLTWCDRVILVCATTEQANILRDHLPMLREFNRDVVFVCLVHGDTTPELIHELGEMLWEGCHDSSGEVGPLSDHPRVSSRHAGV